MQTPPDSPRISGLAADSRVGLLIADNIRLTRILGVGAYGIVYEARDIHTGVSFAVKALNKIGLDARQQRFQKREVQLHYQANGHPNVLSMYRIIDSQDCTYVVLEYCPEGDLFAKITEENQYIREDARACKIFLQLLAAVQHCHSLNIYHRDLKPENIMVTNNGSSIRLADFGLACREPISRDFGCGSTFYMSPECQEANPRPSSWYQSAANDVWALGVILVNLTCGRNPWKRANMDDSTFRAFTKDPKFLLSILPITEELNSILRSIFELDPLKRITIPQLIARMEQYPRMTTGHETPLTPPKSPVHSTDDLDIIMADENMKTIPALRLPSPRYDTAPAPQQYCNYQATNYLPPSPPTSSPGSPYQHSSYTEQAGARYCYSTETLAAQQLWNHGWNPCLYPTQQFVYHYAPYSTVY